MSGERDRVLEAIRLALGRGARSAADARQAHAREVDRFATPRPDWEESLQARFIHRFRRAAGTVARIRHWTEIPERSAAYLSGQGLPLRLAIAPHPALASLDWPEEATLLPPESVLKARVGLTVACAGIAETGTLALASGPETPTGFNFLPEYSLVALRNDDLLDYMESLWERLRAGPGFPPRAVNLVTGPSRTGDVEQKIQLGAHGPRQVHVLLVEEAGPGA